MFGRVVRRLYSTRRPTRRPDAFSARTTSAPLAVRTRREEVLGPVEHTDATEDGLTPTELARYNRLSSLEKLPLGEDGKTLSRLEWVTRLNKRRSRIRGLRTVKRNGVPHVKVVGQPIYLPNIIFKLVRNFTPEGQPYNPYEATFRIPLSVTKTDVRSYLSAMYGVETTYIRTDIYYPRSATRSSYKKAVVGLVDPFYYPQRIEDMSNKEQHKRLQYIEDMLFVGEFKRANRVQRLSMMKKAMGYNLPAGWEEREEARMKANTHGTGRVGILRRIAEQRNRRESQIASQVDQWREKRAKGEKIVLNSNPNAVKPVASTSTSP